MNISPLNVASSNACLFDRLPEPVKIEKLNLINKVNALHLHCEDVELWNRVLPILKDRIVYNYYKSLENSNKIKAKNLPAAQTAVVQTPAIQNVQLQQLNKKNDFPSYPIDALSQEGYNRLLIFLKNKLAEIYYDPLFTDPIVKSLQQNILIPLHKNSHLVETLCRWIYANAMYLPLGTHLIPSFKEDMKGNSEFAKYYLKSLIKMSFLSEALSDESLKRMSSFLADCAQAHAQSYGPISSSSNDKTAVILSVKNGAGGHTAPSQAIAARLKERGWRVETIHYDTDLNVENDVFRVLGVTFEDGTPMTNELYITRWKMQKQNKEVAGIVGTYVGYLKIINADLFIDNKGGDLLRNKILPLNPKVILTTLAYHWSWKSLAYRIPTAKTIVVASDVFFHFQAMLPWYRQRTLPANLRQCHFMTITDDLELLKNMGNHHDIFYPNIEDEHWNPLFEGLVLDEQISLVGAPIHPAFQAITNSNEIQFLRKKWGVPEGSMSVCISRGKLGYETDLNEALSGYQTEEILPVPVVLHVVCGENKAYFEKLLKGIILGPNITVIPHPLRAPKDFAEIRAISTVDDIKAGGASTFEGWYLISKGSQTMLLMTPGTELWWENSNCDAMEKWGIGASTQNKMNKIQILKNLMVNGLPKITNYFPEWKEPFDNLMDKFK